MTVSLDTLRLRSKLNHEIRCFFHEHNYVEVDAPCLIEIPSIEPYIDPVSVQGDFLPTSYLHTSPEYALKKLLARGLGNCFSLGPCFRDEPRSTHHSPEFTMLEWYSTKHSLAQLMDQTESLVRRLWHRLGSPTLSRDKQVIDLEQPFERYTISQIFKKVVGFCPIDCEGFLSLRQKASEHHLRYSPSCDDYDSLFHQLFLNHIEPVIGRHRPCFLWGWPPSQAALARLCPNNSQIALRFELYAGELELANAFDELTDPNEQRTRFETEQKLRKTMGKPIFPLDETLLQSIEEMPQTSGIALGVDRLMMLLLNLSSIQEIRV